MTTRMQMWSMALTAVADHPRSRGVNGDDDVRRREEAGSSPLTRGQHIAIPGIPSSQAP